MPEKLTIEEVTELLEGATVKFSSYYKYSFSFVGKHNDLEIYCSFGGNHDDIYREEVIAGEEKNVLPFEDYWDYVIITRDGEEIFKQSFGW